MPVEHLQIDGVPSSRGRRVATRRSRIHGRGLYALTDIPAGTRLIEYRGRVVSWTDASADHEARGDAGVTYYFDRGDGTVIDGASGGNAARWINHGCEPNCEAIDDAGRIWIHTLTTVHEGEELLLDYALAVDDPADPDNAELYACRCVAPTCRGTMLAAQG